EKEWSPMTVRFFILQAHYRSTLNFSNEALLASEKGLERLWAAMELLDKLPVSEKSTIDVAALREKCFAALNDDLNSPIAIAHLFDSVRMVNIINTGQEKISQNDLNELKQLFQTVAVDILGLVPDTGSLNEKTDETLNRAVELLLNLRLDAKNKKEWATADKIRDGLNALGIEIKDTKEGFEWRI
ncbi:MAG: cysteine--tRNA ligase, partial [Bacteroidales bacterium]|nr:cysteine--tRNA ligase [Bacteroidales bacterium]